VTAKLKEVLKQWRISIQLMKGKGIILSIDSNKRSKLWCDRNNNQRGESLEEFLITSDLLLMNEAAAFLLLKASGRMCGEEGSCADHKIIFCDIKPEESGGIAKISHKNRRLG
jgi:hypothetical protein